MAERGDAAPPGQLWPGVFPMYRARTATFSTTRFRRQRAHCGRSGREGIIRGFGDVVAARIAAMASNPRISALVESYPPIRTAKEAAERADRR